MLKLDNSDMMDLEEMYGSDLINKLDMDNVNKIYDYLINKGIYYAKDIFVERLELFLLDSSEFIDLFDNLIKNIGDNYVDIIGENSSLLEEMYK